MFCRLRVVRWRQKHRVLKFLMLSWMKTKIHGSRNRLSSMWRNRNDGQGNDKIVPAGEKDDGAQGLDSFLIKEDEDPIRMTIIADQGVWVVSAGGELTVEKLKVLALGHFVSTKESESLSSKYKLISVSEKRPLSDGNTINEECIQAQDELLLVESIVSPPKPPPVPDALKGPTISQIQVQTKSLKEKNRVRKHNPIPCSADFQHEVRRILMSLAEASAKILSPTPDAPRLIDLIHEQMKERRVSEIDSLTVKALVDTGFNREVVIKALQRRNMGYQEAVDWLLEHENDTSDGEDPQEPEAGPSKAPHSDDQGLVGAVHALIEKFKANRKREFRLDKRAVANLEEMGFTKKEAEDALKITGNNQNAACEWLLGDRRPSLQFIDQGLDEGSNIYKSLMSNAIIQLSLNNPRMLLAFLSMLDNPNNANLWMSDPEAAPLLNTIFRIYHSEKQFNRFT